jgi:hypothetical protein
MMSEWAWDGADDEALGWGETPLDGADVGCHCRQVKRDRWSMAVAVDGRWMRADGGATF